MKKHGRSVCVSLAIAALLSGCGESKDATPATVDLTGFYGELAETCGWEDTDMVDIEGDMLESYYPGLEELHTEQFLAKMPMMSSVVNELVFLQCTDEDSADDAAEILQARIDTQAQGGAWYPESMEAWSQGVVMQEGAYVAMIASAEYQNEIEQAFSGLFA